MHSVSSVPQCSLRPQSSCTHASRRRICWRRADRTGPGKPGKPVAVACSHSRLTEQPQLQPRQPGNPRLKDETPLCAGRTPCTTTTWRCSASTRLRTRLPGCGAAHRTAPSTLRTPSPVLGGRRKGQTRTCLGWQTRRPAWPTRCAALHSTACTACPAHTHVMPPSAPAPATWTALLAPLVGLPGSEATQPHP